GLAYRQLNHPAAAKIKPVKALPLEGVVSAPTNSAGGFSVAEPVTSFDNISHYNNFYEFSTDKEGVAAAAANFETKGWQVAVEGLVNKPKVFGLDDLLKLSPPEERIYRMRCVEGWSMVIPWAGFSLSKLLDAVEP